MYEAEHAVDEGELNLRAKDILTSLSEESTDDKICFSGLVQVFWLACLKSPLMIRFALAVWSRYPTTGARIAWFFYRDPRSSNLSTILVFCFVKLQNCAKWLGFLLM